MLTNNLRHKQVQPGHLKQRSCFITGNTYISKFFQPSKSWRIWTGSRSLLSATVTTLSRKAFECDVNMAAAAGSGCSVSRPFLFNLLSRLHTRSTCATGLAEWTELSATARRCAITLPRQHRHTHTYNPLCVECDV